MHSTTARAGVLLLAMPLCDSAVADARGRIARVSDEAKGTPWANRPLACYVVPAMSSIKRLPEAIPADGKLGDRLNVVAAKGEFEPVSFVVFPFRDFATLEVTATALKGGNTTIPASAADIKVVKCWYQAGTAWHSYFADPTRRELVPELLLNDERLIEVDRKTKDNYLRNMGNSGILSTQMRLLDEYQLDEITPEQYGERLLAEWERKVEKDIIEHPDWNVAEWPDPPGA